jgi:hypothetical protein
MIVQPSTEQIILDCRRELLEVIGVEVSSDAGKVSVQMLENVLRNAATRAAHEIAWMHDETLALESYAKDVVRTLPDVAASAITSALAALDAGPRTSLHLADVSTVYSLAGEAFSCALEASLGAGHRDLAERGAVLLKQRSDTEVQIMGEWGFVGRG